MKLDEAIYHAFKAHKGQVDKCGEDYILHPLRVMEKCFCFHPPDINTEDVMVVAVLHDVLEDTNYGHGGLFWTRPRFNGTQLDSLTAITKIPYPDETYKDYISRVAENKIATIVKLADLEDNLDPIRMGCLSEQEKAGLTKRYNWSIEYLKEHG